MTDPTLWSRHELATLSAEAIELFRHERLKEPLDNYKYYYDRFYYLFKELVPLVDDLFESKIENRKIAEIVSDSDRLTAFRYFTAPPISLDDLKTLSGFSLSKKGIIEQPESAEELKSIIRETVDPYRFPWLIKNQKPTKEELEKAFMASSCLVATQKVATHRRMASKKEQEYSVKEILRAIGFEEKKPRDIHLIDDAPAPGEFCGESKVASTRADLVIRLRDRRVLPIECKVSNSYVNSYKRLNHEARGKAVAWLNELGTRQIVPAAVLSGVFNVDNLDVLTCVIIYLPEVMLCSRLVSLCES